MTPDDTFRVLKRTRFEDLLKILESLPKVPPLYNLAGNIFESKKHELVKHYEMIKCLEKNGWTFEEFVLETEKRNILEAIEQYNKDCSFPLELVERAKEFFPNARFTQARIDLE